MKSFELKDFVAIAALFASAIALYLSWIQPFTPQFAFRDSIAFLASADAKPTAANLGILIPFTVINEGARPGSIEDMVLIAEATPTPGKRWLFEATFIIDESDFYRQIWDGKPPNSYFKGNFRPILLGPRASVQTAVLFAYKFDSEHFPKTPAPIPGRYRFQLLIREGGRKQFVEIWQAPLIMTEGLFEGNKEARTTESLPLLELRPEMTFAAPEIERLESRIKFGLAAFLAILGLCALRSFVKVP